MKTTINVKALAGDFAITFPTETAAADFTGDLVIEGAAAAIEADEVCSLAFVHGGKVQHTMPNAEAPGYILFSETEALAALLACEQETCTVRPGSH